MSANYPNSLHFFSCRHADYHEQACRFKGICHLPAAAHSVTAGRSLLSAANCDSPAQPIGPSY